jgi:hypothetical protein
LRLIPQPFLAVKTWLFSTAQRVKKRLLVKQAISTGYTVQIFCFPVVLKSQRKGTAIVVPDSKDLPFFFPKGWVRNVKAIPVSFILLYRNRQRFTVDGYCFAIATQIE